MRRDCYHFCALGPSIQTNYCMISDSNTWHYLLHCLSVQTNFYLPQYRTYISSCLIRHQHRKGWTILVHKTQLSTIITWSGLSPVKQNMPIWSVMCCQFWEEPSFLSPACSLSLIVMIRSAIDFTSPNLQWS